MQNAKNFWSMAKPKWPKPVWIELVFTLTF